MRAGLQRKETEKKDLTREIKKLHAAAKDLKRTITECEQTIMEHDSKIKKITAAANKKKKDNVVTSLNSIVKELTELLT